MLSAALQLWTWAKISTGTPCSITRHSALGDHIGCPQSQRLIELAEQVNRPETKHRFARFTAGHRLTQTPPGIPHAPQMQLRHTSPKPGLIKRPRRSDPH